MSVAHTGIPRLKPDVPSIGIDDPPMRRTRRTADSMLLAEHGVIGPRFSETCDERRLGVAVDFGDFGVIGLPLDAERPCVERRQRARVGQVGELERQLELVGELDAHRPNSGLRFSRSAARPSTGSGPMKLSIS